MAYFTVATNETKHPTSEGHFALAFMHHLALV